MDFTSPLELLIEQEYGSTLDFDGLFELCCNLVHKTENMQHNVYACLRMFRNRFSGMPDFKVSLVNTLRIYFMIFHNYQDLHAQKHAHLSRKLYKFMGGEDDKTDEKHGLINLNKVTETAQMFGLFIMVVFLNPLRDRAPITKRPKCLIPNQTFNGHFDLPGWGYNSEELNIQSMALWHCDYYIDLVMRMFSDRSWRGQDVTKTKFNDWLLSCFSYLTPDTIRVFAPICYHIEQRIMFSFSQFAVTPDAVKTLPKHLNHIALLVCHQVFIYLYNYKPPSILVIEDIPDSPTYTTDSQNTSVMEVDSTPETPIYGDDGWLLEEEPYLDYGWRV